MEHSSNNNNCHNNNIHLIKMQAIYHFLTKKIKTQIQINKFQAYLKFQAISKLAIVITAMLVVIKIIKLLIIITSATIKIKTNLNSFESID